MNTFDKIKDYLPKDFTRAETDYFKKNCDFLDENIDFNHSSSLIHSKLHSARVLLYGMMLCSKIFPNDKEKLEIITHASLFHDTRRIDDGPDKGHGARASVNYQNFCIKNHLIFHPESAALIKYHDQDDKLGYEAMNVFENSDGIKRLYGIFKDSDALDRFRLSKYGLNPKFLRNPESKQMMDYAKFLVNSTVSF